VTRRERLLSCGLAVLIVGCAGPRAAVADAVPPPHGRTCRDPGVSLRRAGWDDAQRRGLVHAFDALPGPPSAGPRLAARLDRHAAAWTKARAATCSAARRLGSAEYAAQTACQYGVLAQHAALVRRVVALPAAALTRADAGIDELEDALRRCTRPAVLAEYRGFPPLLHARAELTVADVAIAMEDGSWAQAVAHNASEPAVSAATAAALRRPVDITLAWASWLRGQDRKASLRIDAIAEAKVADPLAAASVAELRLLTRGLDDPEALSDGAAAIASYTTLFGAHDRRIVRVRRELARRHRLLGRLGEAAAELSAALEGLPPGDDDPLRATLAQSLGDVEHLRGDYRSARLHHAAALVARERSFGREQMITAESLFGLGTDLEALGELGAAVDHYARAVEIQQRLAPEDLATARTYNNLGRACYTDRNFVDARRFHTAALEIRTYRLGEQHPETATSINNLGAVTRAEGDLRGALVLFQRALAIRERLLGPHHPYTAISLNNVAEIHAAEGRIAEAIALHTRALEIRRARFGEDHPETARSLHNLGVLYLRRAGPGDREAAKAALTSAGNTRAARLGLEHPETVSTLERLAEVTALAPAETGEPPAEPAEPKPKPRPRKPKPKP
jgi:tetratricopeptide (TPR) repeat protein